MTPAEIIAVAAALGVVAVVYSMVGLGGGTGYLMVMGIAGLAPEVMRPTSLTLNLVVAAIGIVRFARVGGFRWRALWPFVIMSIPFSFIGGAIRVDAAVYRFMVAALLLFAAYRLAVKVPARTGPEAVKAIPIPAALILGAAIGIVSGLIGMGGGILLGPVLLLFGWATARQTAGVTAAFIFINSSAALAGFVFGHQSITVEPGAMAVFVAVALVGGLIGTGIGTRRLGHVAMRRVLAAILVFASLKMIIAPAGPAPAETTPASGTIERQDEVAQLGYQLVIYPVSMQRLAMGQVARGLDELRQRGTLPGATACPKGQPCDRQLAAARHGWPRRLGKPWHPG